jgi:glycosyltransferase involved in cell wall biosynthesis
MACGVPAIVTAVGAVPDVVDHGRAGVLVPRGDRAALAREIAALGGDADRRAALAGAGLRRVRERHSAERMAREYETLYASVLGEL